MTCAQSKQASLLNGGTDIEPEGQKTKIMSDTQHSELVSFIWKNAEDLWGNFKRKRNQYPTYS